MPQPRSHLVIGTTVLLAVSAFTATVVYKTALEARFNFDPKPVEYLFERDATMGELPEMPSDLFSPEKVERYYKGGGFQATFRTLKDPRDNYGTTTKSCGVESWTGPYGQMDHPSRRKLVSRRQVEFEECVRHFTETLSVLQTIEIGLDDTEGVDGEMMDFVTFNLERSLGSPEGFLTSGEATWLSTRLTFFLISRNLVPRRRSQEIEPWTGKEAAKAAFEDGLEWLLAPAGRKEETALADNLLSIFKESQDVALRRILIFSDGMENSPATTSFYRVLKEPRFLDPLNYDALDKSISSLEGFPDLRSARITWYIPPRPGRHFRAVARYWEHVLEDLGNNPRVEVIY